MRSLGIFENTLTGGVWIQEESYSNDGDMVSPIVYSEKDLIDYLVKEGVSSEGWNEPWPREAAEYFVEMGLARCVHYDSENETVYRGLESLLFLAFQSKDEG